MAAALAYGLAGRVVTATLVRGHTRSVTELSKFMIE